MHLALRLAPMGEFGALQRFGGGLNGAVGVLWPRLRLEGSATHLWPRRLEVSPGKGALAQIGVLALAACGRLRTGSLEFPLCAGVESGWVRAGSRGVEPGSVVHGPWLAPLARVGVSWSNTRVALWSAFTAAPPVVTTRFLVGPDAAEPVLPLSLRFSLGIEFFVSIQ